MPTPNVIAGVRIGTQTTHNGSPRQHITNRRAQITRWAQFALDAYNKATNQRRRRMDDDDTNLILSRVLNRPRIIHLIHQPPHHHVNDGQLQYLVRQITEEEATYQRSQNSGSNNHQITILRRQKWLANQVEDGLVGEFSRLVPSPVMVVPETALRDTIEYVTSRIQPVVSSVPVEELDNARLLKSSISQWTHSYLHDEWLKRHNPQTGELLGEKYDTASDWEQVQRRESLVRDACHQYLQVYFTQHPDMLSLYTGILPSPVEEGGIAIVPPYLIDLVTKQVLLVPQIYGVVNQNIIIGDIQHFQHVCSDTARVKLDELQQLARQVTHGRLIPLKEFAVFAMFVFTDDPVGFALRNKYMFNALAEDGAVLRLYEHEMSLQGLTNTLERQARIENIAIDRIMFDGPMAKGARWDDVKNAFVARDEASNSVIVMPSYEDALVHNAALLEKTQRRRMQDRAVGLLPPLIGGLAQWQVLHDIGRTQGGIHSLTSYIFYMDEHESMYCMNVALPLFMIHVTQQPSPRQGESTLPPPPVTHATSLSDWTAAHQRWYTYPTTDDTSVLAINNPRTQQSTSTIPVLNNNALTQPCHVLNVAIPAMDGKQAIKTFNLMRQWRTELSIITAEMNTEAQSPSKDGSSTVNNPASVSGAWILAPRGAASVLPLNITAPLSSSAPSVTRHLGNMNDMWAQVEEVARKAYESKGRRQQRLTTVANVLNNVRQQVQADKITNAAQMANDAQESLQEALRLMRDAKRRLDASPQDVNLQLAMKLAEAKVRMLETRWKTLSDATKTIMTQKMATMSQVLTDAEQIQQVDVALQDVVDEARPALPSSSIIQAGGRRWLSVARSQARHTKEWITDTASGWTSRVWKLISNIFAFLPTWIRAKLTNLYESTSPYMPVVVSLAGAGLAVYVGARTYQTFYTTPEAAKATASLLASNATLHARVEQAVADVAAQAQHVPAGKWFVDATETFGKRVVIGAATGGATFKTGQWLKSFLSSNGASTVDKFVHHLKSTPPPPGVTTASNAAPQLKSHENPTHWFAPYYAWLTGTSAREAGNQVSGTKDGGGFTDAFMTWAFGWPTAEDGGDTREFGWMQKATLVLMGMAGLVVASVFLPIVIPLAIPLGVLVIELTSRVIRGTTRAIAAVLGAASSFVRRLARQRHAHRRHRHRRIVRQ